MKRFMSCLFLLPLLTSCLDEGRYYQSGYYAPPPPPPRVEHRHQQYEHHGYEQVEAPRARVEGHHGTYHHSEGTHHGHASGSKVIVHGSTEGRY